VLTRFNPDSSKPVQGVTTKNEQDLVRALVDARIPLNELISDRHLSGDDALEIIKLVSRTAVALNLPGVVAELGTLRELGKSDPALAGVPEVNPVLKAKAVPLGANGLPLDPTAAPETEVPFNIEVLRRHLAQVSFARQVLPGDPAARQKLLEESVIDVAQHRLQHEAEQLAKLELGPKGAQGKGLQIWMWEWHQALSKKLKVDIPQLLRDEAKLSDSQSSLAQNSSADTDDAPQSARTFNASGSASS
jgi:DNA-directed RNA polymerase